MNIPRQFHLTLSIFLSVRYLQLRLYNLLSERFALAGSSKPIYCSNDIHKLFDSNS